jgi:hypothetical protein
MKNIKNDLTDRRKLESEMKQEILVLKSKLEDEIHKNYRSESLLQLRGEYIRTLQETDEVNKARLTLQAKDIEDLAAKLAKAKKFKAATQEETNNMHNTLKNQELEIVTLKREIEVKDAKVKKYKSKLKEIEA